SFTDSAGGRFAINATTGQITVADGSLLHYEVASSHSVTVQVIDSGGLTYDKTFTINLININEAPTDLLLSSNTIVENAAIGTVVGTITGTDPDAGDTKTYSLTDSAGGRFAINSATGAITVADGSLLNYESATSHSVTVRVTDSGGLTYDETFTINLSDLNETPMLINLSGNTVAENAANGTVIGTVSTTDPDASDVHTYSLVDSAGGRFTIDGSTGVITVADGSLLDYESAPTHSITIQTTDAGGLTHNQTVTINLTNINEAPAGADATITINEDMAYALTIVNFGFSDVDAGDSLSAVRIDSLPAAGTLTLSGTSVTAGQIISVADITAGNLVFTPAANANGTGYASITFSVRDSGNLYDTGPNTLTFDVTAVNDAPVNTVPGAQTVTEDMPLTITGLSVTDVDDNLATVELSVGNGTLWVSMAGGAMISAGTNDSGTLTLSGTQGQINAALATLTYQGTLNFNGSDILTITSTDANSGTDVDTVVITVTAVDDPTGVTGGTSGSGSEETTISNTLTATDVEGLSDGSVFTVSGAASNGTASIDPGTGLWSYTPNADWHGSDSFTVTITDDAGNSVTHVISVTVSPVGDITNDSLTTNEDTAISANVLTGTNGATADSFEGSPVLTSVTQGAHGSVTFLANGTVTYTPDANFNGTDSFTYTITSGGVTETATVTVQVTAVNDPTVVMGGTSGSGSEETTISNTLTVTDVEGVSDGGVFTVSANASNGTASIDPATGLWSYTPNADYHGSDSFTVTITDDAGNTATQVISVTV
uniref:beta strand repeat-containing protein n=1 Tax=Nitrospira cf. moscoviensis SBR1015 TaxID=96242 RepID=UPI00117E0851